MAVHWGKPPSTCPQLAVKKYEIGNYKNNLKYLLSQGADIKQLTFEMLRPSYDLDAILEVKDKLPLDEGSTLQTLDATEHTEQL